MLYDGWPLVFEPGSPAALHLLELFDLLPEGVEAWVALPGETPISVDAKIRPLTVQAPTTTAGRMIWEQAHLPGLARKCQAQVLHTTSMHVPLVSPVPCLVSPAEILSGGSAGARGLAGRLREAFGRGGLSNSLLLWPEDLPAPEVSAPWLALPPVVHRAFRARQPYRADLPAMYVLVAGPLPEEVLPLLAAAWGWAAAGLEADCPLVTTELSAQGVQALRERCLAAGIDNPVERVIAQSVEERAGLFQQAAAVLVVGPLTAWGDAVSQALASGCPLVGVETRWMDARVGPAGYLVRESDARGLGAALLTLLVEEPVAEGLSEAARKRAEGWKREDFRERLGEVYEKAARGNE